MRKSAGAVAALILGIAAASMLPLASAKTAATTMHITAKTLELNGATDPPKAGDRFIFYEADSGDARGHDHAVCTVTNAKSEALCHLDFVLSRGTITIEGIVDLSKTTQHDVGAITGGTGRYAGARGTWVATGTPTDTKFTLRLFK